RRPPVPHRSGCGRRRLLPGPGGGHHRAHPAVHPGGGLQHLQCHADEPQQLAGHTRAAQLAPERAQVLRGPPSSAEDRV
ncbi:transmembrane protein 245-like, partial [Arapaima gigas]